MRNIAMTIIVVALVLLSFWWAGERFDASPTMRDNLPSDARECHEDMPCWDCTTMGNHICGDTKGNQ